MGAVRPAAYNVEGLLSGIPQATLNGVNGSGAALEGMRPN
jgi:hypothetical protein